MSMLGGYRWSLYVVVNDKDIAYAMHENSVIRIVGYVMEYFASGQNPVAPWSLYLNFNNTHQIIRLRHEHFTADGDNITSLLLREIQEIDPYYRVKGNLPIFEEAATRREIPLSEYESGGIDIEKMLATIHNPKPVTFFSVMDTVFGKDK
jgi:hypothetical protein